jgi:antitoxin component YwqK of YwqJK toxin-antitoxin module
MRMVLGVLVLCAGAVLAQRLFPASGAEPRLTYYADGTLKSSMVYVDGLREGPAEQFHPDGTPEWRGSFARGEREGRWTFWTPGGAIDAERSGRYSGGVKVGD